VRRNGGLIGKLELFRISSNFVGEILQNNCEKLSCTGQPNYIAQTKKPLYTGVKEHIMGKEKKEWKGNDKNFWINVSIGVGAAVFFPFCI